MSALDLTAGGAGRLRPFARLARWALGSETGTSAAAIAYQMMFAFFPALLLLKSLQDYLGGAASGWVLDPRRVGIELPGPVLGLTRDFMAAAHGLTGDLRPLAEVAFVFLVLRGLAKVFEEYAGAFHAMIGEPLPLLRRKLVAAASAGLVLLTSLALFVWVNASAGPGGALTLAFALLILLVGMAGFFRLLTRGRLSEKAILAAAAFGVAAWSAGTTLVFRIEFDFAEEQRLYGTVAAAVVLLLWFYVTARLLLLALAFGYFIVDKGRAP